MSSGDWVSSFSRADLEEVRVEEIWEEICERRSDAVMVGMGWVG